MNPQSSRSQTLLRGPFQKSPRLVRSLVVLALCAPSAAILAVEPNGLQFRFTVGVAPGITELTTTKSKKPDGTSDNVNNGIDAYSPFLGYSFEPGVIYSILVKEDWGYEFGLNFITRSAKGSADYTSGTQIDLKLQTVGADFVSGMYWKNDRWRLEFTPVFGAGQARTSINVISPLGNTKDTTEDCLYINYGFRVGAYLTLPQYVLLGLQVGYLEFQTAAASLRRADGSTEEDEVRGGGMVAALSFVLVF